MLDPVKWQSTALHLVELLLVTELMGFALELFFFFFVKFAHVKEVFPGLINGLDSLAAVLNETLLLRCVLHRVLPTVHIRMLDVQWVIARVYLATDEVEGNFSENFRICHHSLVVRTHFSMVNLSIFIQDLLCKT